MTQDTRKSGASNDEKRHDADKNDKLDSYDEVLDEAVEETFPASDPISPAVAEKADRKRSASKDAAEKNAPRDEADKRKK